MAGNQVAFAIKAINEATKVLKDVQDDIEGIGEESEKADKKSGRFSTTMSGLGKHLGDVAKIAGGFIVAEGIQKMGGFLVDAAKGAADDAAATARLERALKNAGGAFDDHLEKVNERIDAGAKLAFSDDDVRDSFQQLLAATGDVDEALSRQTVAMDLSRGAGISLEAATRMVGKVTEENVEAFKRMGITIGEGATEAEALAAIQAKFAGQSETYAASTAGQFEQSSIAMSELKEQLGTALLPVMAKVGEVLVNDVIPAIQKFADEAGPKIQAFAEDVKRYWESDIKPAIDNLRAAWEELAPVILPILAQIQNMVETAAKVIVLSLGIIVDLLSGDFSGAWNKTKELIKTVVDFWWESIKNAVDLIKGLIKIAKEVGGDIINGLWDGLKDKIPDVINWFAELPVRVLRALGDAGRVLWDAGRNLVEGLFGGIRDAFNAGFDGIKSMLDPRNWDIPGLSPFPVAMKHAGEIGGKNFGQSFAGNIVASLAAAAPMVSEAIRGVVKAQGVGGARPGGTGSARTTSDGWAAPSSEWWDAGNRPWFGPGLLPGQVAYDNLLGYHGDTPDSVADTGRRRESAGGFATARAVSTTTFVFPSYLGDRRDLMRTVARTAALRFA